MRIVYFIGIFILAGCQNTQDPHGKVYIKSTYIEQYKVYGEYKENHYILLENYTGEKFNEIPFLKIAFDYIDSMNIQSKINDITFSRYAPNYEAISYESELFGLYKELFIVNFSFNNEIYNEFPKVGGITISEGNSLKGFYMIKYYESLNKKYNFVQIGKNFITDSRCIVKENDSTVHYIQFKSNKYEEDPYLISDACSYIDTVSFGTPVSKIVFVPEPNFPGKVWNILSGNSELYNQTAMLKLQYESGDNYPNLSSIIYNSGKAEYYIDMTPIFKRN